MGVEILVCVPLIAVIAFLCWLLWVQRREFAGIEVKLLDRIMTRNYETLVQGDIAKAQAEKPMTAEEIYDMQQERGIPV